VVNGHSFILIRQMAALVNRALAEVCIIPVHSFYNCILLQTTVCIICVLYCVIYVCTSSSY